MFIAFTFVAASGLATLETAANSYITVLGPPSQSAMRLTFAQAFNGIATVIGPIIASHTFFNGANQYSLDTVQYVYLALACFALLLNILVGFATLPEVKQAITVEQEDKISGQSFWKQYHTLFGAREFGFLGFSELFSLLQISFSIFLHRCPGCCGLLHHILHHRAARNLSSLLFRNCFKSFLGMPSCLHPWSIPRCHLLAMD